MPSGSGFLSSLGSWASGWFGRWMGVSSPILTDIITTTIDCEGACCCRCYKCNGHGYHQNYDINIPQPVAVPGSVVPTCDGWGDCFPWTITVSITTTILAPQEVTDFSGCPGLDPDTGNWWGYGSEGGVGCCRWIAYFYDALGQIPCTTSASVISLTLDHEKFVLYVGYISGVFEKHVFYADAAADCLGTMTYTYDASESGFTTDGGATWNAFLTTTCYYDFTGLSVSVSPSATGDYYQCGENEDGSPYDAPEGPMAPVMAAIQKAVGPRVKVNARKPLPLAHPDRCQHLGKRTEKRAGCNGWKCAHDCDKGLPAVPGAYCQSCDSYEADADFVGQGSKGWLS